MATTETMPPPKISRYRTVRRAQEQQTQEQESHAPTITQLPTTLQSSHPLGPSHHLPSSPPTAPPPMPAAVPDMSPHDATLSRSMSRYHRRPTVSSHANTPRTPAVPFPPPPPPSLLPKPPLPLPPPTYVPPTPAPVLANAPTAARHRAESSPHYALHAANSGQYCPRTTRQEKYTVEARAVKEAKQAELNRLEALRQLEEESLQRKVQQQREEESLQRKAQQQREDEALQRKAQQQREEAEALRRQKEELPVEKDRGRRLQKAETQRVLQQREEGLRRAKADEKDHRALEKQISSHTHTSSPPASPPRHDVGYGLFKRRNDVALYPDKAPQVSSPPHVALQYDTPELETIRPGGGGAVLGIDAPNSAVNAGDRRVTVVCNKKRIQLPVTPTTTPLDLIKTAATVLTDPIDVRTAVLSELFSKVSITRPLRNYEYVRDVMNSWDYDTQNDLTIIDSDMDGINQDDLLSYKVPETRPEGMSCFIQYSSRPGKWSKRYLTLRPDGQLVMAKNDKVKDKDHENVCTLTDYDIYSITPQKLARVKPPKKICYAVKSMQKSNIFADESQYVHFFCTNDRGTATAFYQALQRWRSWHLKYQMGEGLKKKTTAPKRASAGETGQPPAYQAAAAPSAAAATTTATAAPGHNRGESVGSHYQLGAFKPLLDLNDFNRSLDAIEVHRPGEFPEDRPLAKLDTQTMHARKRSIRVKQPPPNAFSRSAQGPESACPPPARSGSVRRSMEQPGGDKAFASGSLLGRAYTQRQAAVQAREQESANPFTEGPSLLASVGRSTQTSTNEGGVKRTSSVRSTHQRTSGELRRSTSKRAPGLPQPLVDLTPTYQPPPQFASKNRGRGYHPGPGPGPLVDSATSPEEAIKVPSSTDWRARAGGGPRTAHGTHGHGGSERTRSLQGRGEPLAAYTQNNHAGAPEDETRAFTGGGLLSTAGYSQGHAPVGRGVMDGSKAKGPMLDFGDEKQFASGSLLSGLPNTNELVIDRSGK